MFILLLFPWLFSGVMISYIVDLCDYIFFGIERKDDYLVTIDGILAGPFMIFSLVETLFGALIMYIWKKYNEGKINEV